jgi:exo-beta-1,3-glucanase (GH17 family)/cellulose synthase/poly-beta-1,6-N-acetylglucosamine synthase-like glycosyltransferase
MRHLIPRLLILVLVIGLHFAITAWLNPSSMAPPWAGLIKALSFHPHEGGGNDAPIPTHAINEALQNVKSLTKTIRTYSVANNLHLVPALAKDHGLDVMLGVWLSKNTNSNEIEIETAIDVARRYTNVKTIIVGNEAILREDISEENLITAIRKVQETLDKPVTTAEPWHIWLKHPRLAAAVDVITIHTLPYWEGIAASEAVAHVMARYGEVRARYPDKKIVIGEVGWPSEGQWIKAAEPSGLNQAKFIRQFLNVADRTGIDYTIVEAFDQPWKQALEGTVGAHWGLMSTNGQQKFSMTDTIQEDNRWYITTIIATLFALWPMVMFLRRQHNLRNRGLFFYTGLIQAVFAMLVWAITAALEQSYMNATNIAWAFLIGAQIVLLVVLLVDGFELTEVLWAQKRKREFLPSTMPLHKETAPFVSIHVPCYNEPPAMVIETLNALAALDYPNVEVLCIDNNTKDEAVWRPLADHCEKLGPRFRFFHLPNWPGYKAGALNFALDQTNPAATIIGVIDSDYIVKPDWLAATIPYFERAEVGFVQAPQDYRDWQDDAFKRMMYWEYAGFFHIGMVHRNERNAIIQHGTMTLIRRTALQSHGGWAEWCICEDAELGLRLFEKGYEAVYLEHSFGKGLVPDQFSGYKSQRFRWAYGAVQIVKHHLKSFIPGGKELTTGQRYHFVSGWMPWFADAAHMVFALAAIFWSGLLLMKWVEFPPTVFLVPTLSVFLFKIAAGLMLYEARVKCGLWDRLGAAIAGMALTHTVGRAVWQGLFTSGKPFIRTPKMENSPALIKGLMMAFEEIILLISLLGLATTILFVFEISNRDAVVWSSVLAVQTLPYIAAVTMALANSLQKDTLPPPATLPDKLPNEVSPKKIIVVEAAKV